MTLTSPCCDPPLEAVDAERAAIAAQFLFLSKIIPGTPAGNQLARCRDMVLQRVGLPAGYTTSRGPAPDAEPRDEADSGLTNADPNPLGSTFDH